MHSPINTQDKRIKKWKDKIVIDSILVPQLILCQLTDIRFLVFFCLLVGFVLLWLIQDKFSLCSLDRLRTPNSATSASWVLDYKYILHFISGIFTQVLSLYGRKGLWYPLNSSTYFGVWHNVTRKNTAKVFVLLCNTYIPTNQHKVTPWCKMETEYQEGTRICHERRLRSSQRYLLSRKEINS